MRRLQIGGLVMYIPTGEVFSLLAFIGEYDYGGVMYRDCWRVKSDEKCVLDGGFIVDVFLVPQQYLMPLGDKQTQDELRKEETSLEYLNTVWL